MSRVPGFVDRVRYPGPKPAVNAIPIKKRLLRRSSQEAYLEAAGLLTLLENGWFCGRFLVVAIKKSDHKVRPPNFANLANRVANCTSGEIRPDDPSLSPAGAFQNRSLEPMDA